ncbi:flagellar hook-length control protein FliK [Roseovarius sp. SCSIO 43702]|uniref:flagellar hook-length control protein FliK n=1 Tax=Roseovarius sp. SCSIO 43702 TaxID=2823043 RepID=UPI001C72E585|nr:flagellar hook-length control protein FliK [Roseovarius sp. SCSIO 43702]QYX57106.1 flagellar hook-length control protein FliK [Roseovarius sp. SCSIO 43702]
MLVQATIPGGFMLEAQISHDPAISSADALVRGVATRQREGSDWAIEFKTFFDAHLSAHETELVAAQSGRGEPEPSVPESEIGSGDGQAPNGVAATGSTELALVEAELPGLAGPGGGASRQRAGSHVSLAVDGAELAPAMARSSSADVRLIHDETGPAGSPSEPDAGLRSRLDAGQPSHPAAPRMPHVDREFAVHATRREADVSDNRTAFATFPESSEASASGASDAGRHEQGRSAGAVSEGAVDAQSPPLTAQGTAPASVQTAPRSDDVQAGSSMKASGQQHAEGSEARGDPLSPAAMPKASSAPDPFAETTSPLPDEGAVNARAYPVASERETASLRQFAARPLSDRQSVSAAAPSPSLDAGRAKDALRFDRASAFEPIAPRSPSEPLHPAPSATNPAIAPIPFEGEAPQKPDLSAVAETRPSTDAARPAPEVPGGAPRAADIVRQVTHQVTQTSASIGERSVEITLNPVELGRVRLAMVPGDGTMMVTVIADRPETLDLLRRHIDLLAQDFRDLGYGRSEFSFDQDTQRKSGTFASRSAPAGAAEAHPEDTAPVATRVSLDGLDLRL